MAWKYGLWFRILVIMFSCISDNKNLAKASCSEMKQLIVLVNETYTGVIRYFNISENTTVETYVIATANYSQFTNESCGVAGYYLNGSLESCKIYHVQNFSGINFTWNLFPSCLLQSNYTCDYLYSILKNDCPKPTPTNTTTTNSFTTSTGMESSASTTSTLEHASTTTNSFTTSTGMESSASTTSTLEHASTTTNSFTTSIGMESSASTTMKYSTLSPVSSTGRYTTADIDNIKNYVHSLVDNMGDDTLAYIDFGVVKGIIEVFPKKTNHEDVMYILTNNSDFAKLYDGTEVNFLNSFMIPGEAIDIAQKENNKSFISIVRFPPMIEDKENILNPGMFDIEMGTSISNLSRTINITYTNFPKENKNLNCCWWNGTGQPSWKMDGCSSKEINNTFMCGCTHLTFFAVLMSNPVGISNSDVKKLTYITYIGCGVSTFFLGIALFRHVTLRRSKSTKTTKILMNLFVSMFMLNITFLLNDSITSLKNDPLCKFIAGAIHYFLLSTFTWFAIEAFHLYLQLIKVFNINIRYYMVKTLVVGWAFPLLVPSVIGGLGKYGNLAINTSDNKTVYMCWITDSSVSYIVNIGYYVAVFIFTSVVFMMVVRKIVYLRKANVGQPKRRSVSKDIFMVAALCSLLGITWGFAFFSSGPLLIPSYYIFTILNSFQGFFLFVYYCMINNNDGESRKSAASNMNSTSTVSNTNISHSTVSKSQ